MEIWAQLNFYASMLRDIYLYWPTFINFVLTQCCVKSLDSARVLSSHS